MKTRVQILEGCLAAGIQLVKEQDAAGMGMAPQQPPPQPMPDAGPVATPPNPEGQAAVTNADGQPLTVDSLIDRLNVIRGGKSFSDPEVYGQLTSLFKSMSAEDQSSIDRILMDIGKSVMNTQEGQPGQTGNQAQVGMPPPANAAPAGGAPQPVAGGSPPIAAM